MIKHNLKFILRSLWSRKIYTAITLLSLTAGFVCTNMLISFLVFETNTDTFHTKRDRTFQTFSNDPFGGKGLVAYIPDYFHEYLTVNYPEIVSVCQIADMDGLTLKGAEAQFDNLTILSVDSSFFSIFDFPLIQGRKDKCLASDNVVVSKEKALTLFGTADVVGKLLTISTSDTTREFVISGVVDKASENSHLHFDALMHHSTFPEKWNGGATYVLLTSSGAREPLSDKIHKDRQRPGLIGLGQMNYFFVPLTESYFTTDNKASYMSTRNPMLLTVGYVVCGLVLFIASFNFINLFLLSAQSRRKEIGIKKTFGVTRQGLFQFSLVEAGVYVFIAFVLSSIISVFSVSVFNDVFEAKLSPAYFFNLKVLGLFGAVLFLVGLLVVALSVSRQWAMKPISLMAKDGAKVKFSKMLFTIQFVISITLAICAVTIVEQMNYIENAPLGFNRQIIQLNAPDKKGAASLPVLKENLLQLANVDNVTVGNGNPIFENMVARYDLANEQFYTPYLFSGDEDYLKTLDLQLVEGELPSELKKGKLVNETLVRQFDMKAPVGARIPGTEDVIVGVVKDFTCGSFKQEIPPAIISYSAMGNVVLIDYRGNDLATVLPQLQSEWRNVYPDHSFSFRLLQEELMSKYKEDSFFYRIIVTFSMISMVLSCFGLFALSWAVVQSRTKEMGIRKVLGANQVDILNLLTLTFTKRIAFAFLLAAPVGYFLMSEWLTRFANKIELNVWIFGVSGLLVVVIAVITLSLQTVRATMINPVDEIRNG